MATISGGRIVTEVWMNRTDRRGSSMPSLVRSAKIISILNAGRVNAISALPTDGIESKSPAIWDGAPSQLRPRRSVDVGVIIAEQQTVREEWNNLQEEWEQTRQNWQ